MCFFYFVGNATNNCPEIPHINNLVSDSFLYPNIPEVHVTLLKFAKNNKILHMNHPCALSNNYGHYSHHCPCIEDFHDTLQVLRELDVTHIDSASTLLAGFGPSHSPG